ncbi:MAG TPA: hypothetical protein VK809_12590 [Bacteroidia bacterium]|jgi:hypothetical protein|nr:hypothetical protein [Bacteroidia bacterium]
MKSVLSILVLFSFLVVNMSKSIILINYQLNKVEITAKYCVNKDKPEMHCCGKCLLKKKLAEQEEQQSFPAFPDIKTDIQLVHQVHQVYKVCQVQQGPDSPLYELCELFTQFEGKGFFHPPSIA